jgi:hypothetical protein
MQIIKKFTFALVVIVVLIFPTAAFAQGPGGGDEVIFNESYRLESGESLDGNLIVFGGSADLERDSTVEGDIMQFGGRVTLSGEVIGSVEIFGGVFEMTESAVIHGDFSNIGGDVQRSPDAQVLGEEFGAMDLSRTLMIPFFMGSNGIFGERAGLENLGFLDFLAQPEFMSPRVSLERSFDFGDFDSSFAPYPIGGPLQEFLSALIQALFYGILAALIVLFLQRPADRVRRAAAVQPFLAGGLGLITIVLAVPILILIGLTLILLPLSAFAFFALLALVIFGWVAIGMEVGSRVGLMFRRDWHPALAAGVGVLALSLAKAALWQIPCVGGLLTLVVASVGLGALWLTRLGTREYQLNSDLPAEIS